MFLLKILNIKYLKRYKKLFTKIIDDYFLYFQIIYISFFLTIINNDKRYINYV